MPESDAPQDRREPELDERKATVLRAVVSSYIETAQPVGSGHVARAPGVTVSPATVRNDMAVLEAEGYLHQPHTSAGRVPTEKGYRFFVDRLDSVTALAAADTRQVRSFFAEAHGELEQMLADTSQLLSDLTRYAAVVVGPPTEAAIVRSVQVVGLAPRVALVVVVLSNGAVDKHTLEFDEDLDEAVLNASGVWLTQHLTGEPLASAGRVLTEFDARAPKPPLALDTVVRAALGVLADEHSQTDHVYIGGTSRMAAAFDAVDTVSQVLKILEQQYVVVTLLHDVVDRGLQVAIGTETGMAPLAECAVVVSPYEVEGELVGTIGVLGPTRMNYPQALAAVAVVGQRLGRHLREA
ncbi:MAG TPA: heat-inducible transcriptional repressor HrcA [Acidimicrobiales bacterium]|nr:heat-inducible transcriptional repressor HrcA [Acidimicrobiales bacterium]